MAMNGMDVLLLINTGTVGSPVYSILGSQRDVSFDETTAEIDASSKDARSTRVLPGRYKATVTLEALYVPTDAAYQALKDAMRNGTFILIRRQETTVDLEEADCIITKLGEPAPDQDVVIVNAELTIDDMWTPVGT